MARERLRGAAVARVSADHLVQRLVQELAEARREAAGLRLLLDLFPEGGEVGGAGRLRGLCTLEARLAGRPEPPAARRRRNVAWHAAFCPGAGASASAWTPPVALRVQRLLLAMAGGRLGGGGASGGS